MSDKSQDKKPPVSKEQKEEFLSRARQFITAAAEQMGTGTKDLSREAEEYLLACEWPGGDREMEIAVKRACILAENPLIEVEDFDLKYRQTRSIGKFVESKLKGFMRNIKQFEKFNLYDMVIPEVEKSLILMVMKETRGNQIRAASLLGINRNTLRSKIKKLGISVKAK